MGLNPNEYPLPLFPTLACRWAGGEGGVRGSEDF